MVDAMDMNKPKKRGRPAQLLQMAELHAFVEFLLEKDQRTELQDQVVDALQTNSFNFELLSEAQQVLVKEALKPYREHTKLQLLAEQLKAQDDHSDYEAKFLVLYSDYEKGNLEPADRNILKTMCTRYLNFKAQKLQDSDLALYLSQIQKKEAHKKRKSENNRKFEVGGGVLSYYRAKNDDTLNTEKLLKRVNMDRYLSKKLRQSSIFKKIYAFDLDLKAKYELLFAVLEELAKLELKKSESEIVKIIDFTIDITQKKLKKKSETNQ